VLGKVHLVLSFQNLGHSVSSRSQSYNGQLEAWKRDSMISFIIPAHNEEALLGRTLMALHQSARDLGEPYEVIVSNDASTDRTGEIAREHGARVVVVNHRQIAATRNSGAAEAAGEWLIFIDADTQINEAVLSAAIGQLRAGAVGGGCCIRFDGQVPIYARVLERVLPPILRLLRLAPGCFLFCTRTAYLAAGKFDASFYFAEEVDLVKKLRRRGRFIILNEYVITSARKLRSRSLWDFVRMGIQLALGGQHSRWRREGLNYWYGPRESDPADYRN
jgi:glycosyltransferase involved in cell wall biosynthesis